MGEGEKGWALGNCSSVQMVLAQGHHVCVSVSEHCPSCCRPVTRLLEVLCGVPMGIDCGGAVQKQILCLVFCHFLQLGVAPRTQLHC